MKEFLRVDKTKILAGKKPVVLKGLNLGGWLMMEGYFMHSLNIAEQVFKKDFTGKLGPQELKKFEKAFRDHFIQESDFAKISKMGCNCLRVPFNYRLIEKKAYQYDKAGVRYLDEVVRWARKYKLWIILDLHAAPGAQNHDWHSDSLGQAELWNKKSFQRRTLSLWEFLADRYKDEKAIAGYDVINEAVVGDVKKLNQFYARVIKSIRKVDKNHILFIEGNNWATDIACLDDFDDDNLALSIHFYQPLDFTFNFVPQLSYPLKGFHKATIRKMVQGYARLAKKRARPVLVGEFGVNARAGLYGEDLWLKDTLACFEEAGFHWTYWTYKAVKNSVFPDGVFSYRGNPPWVNRPGPKLGWDNYAECWPKQKKEMASSWQTKSFAENKEILKVLKTYL
ncbi:MAG: glycoside hydrolase family 5 protein [Candidatus Omnitrophica bacterium]|nr:glycoside hydrolase family 5 protein [Candidatus Omnitrophota bacterium]